MMKWLLFWVSVWGFFACEPAKSDVYAEQVNQALVDDLIARAKARQIIAADSITRIANPFWVQGLRLQMNGENNTTTIWYDENGAVRGLVEAEGGICRDSIHFYPNGQRMFTLLFSNTGKASGPARFYYPDGRVKEDGRFDNGIKSGVWRLFDSTGKLVKATEFDRSGNAKR